MLSEKKISQNKEKFKEVNIEYKILTPELEDFLGEELYLSPASTHLNMFGSYPGGLLQHMFLICKYSIKLNEFFPEKMRIDKGLIMRTVILSQIGKVGVFKINNDEWRVKNLGEIYRFVEDEVALKISEKSIYLSNKYGVDLIEEQYQSILNLDKTDDLTSKHHSTLLSKIIKYGIGLATLEMKNG